MVFHVRITFRELQEDGDLTVAGIGDTVVVESSGNVVNLTQKIPSKVSAIMYTLDDEEEDEKQNEMPAQKYTSTRDEA